MKNSFQSDWYKSMEGKPVAETMYNDFTFSLVKRGDNIEVFESWSGTSIGTVINCNLSDTDNEDFYITQEKKIWDFIKNVKKY